MSFFAELKRRNVFKVGVAYVIVAWLLIQITDIVAPALRLPDWTLTLIIYLFIIGFPLALFLAWVFELTPEGIKPTEAVGPGESISRVTGQKLNYVIFGLMALAIAFLVINNYVLEHERTEGNVTRDESKEKSVLTSESGKEKSAATEIKPVMPAPPLKSVAVLPFLDLSEGGDQDWFADGLAEEILNSLAQLPELLVTSRTSSFQFRGENRDPAEIATRLGVANIIEGSVRRIGDEMRVTVQLIRTADGFHLWSEVYPSSTQELFKVQRDIAEKVAAALNIVLDDASRERMFRSGTRNVEAFEAYQRGWALFEAAHNAQNGTTLWDANVYFERAMKLDSGYAEAALGHMDAFSHVLLEGGTPIAPDPPYSQEEALKLMLKDLDFAIAHSPTPTKRIVAEINRQFFSPTWYRIPTLIEQLRQQPDFDSLNMAQTEWLADILQFTGSHDLLYRLLEKARTEDPLSSITWFYSILAEIADGNYDAAHKFIAKAYSISDHPLLHMMDMTLARLEGKHNEAIQQLKFIANSDSTSPAPAFAEALLAVVNGDNKTALRYADKRESEWPDLNLMILYYEMGTEDRLHALARRIDALPAGPASFVAGSYFINGSRYFYDPGDMPNFTAKLIQAGIDPASFKRPLPRLSATVTK